MQNLPFTMHAIKDAYQKGVTPETIIDEVFRRIEAINDPGIFIHFIDKDEVISAAKSLHTVSKDLPLWGIPCVIKDNMDMTGKPTTAACPAFQYEANKDAFVVKKLKQAGALIIGKTNLDQFATGLAGLRSPYPPPKNAVDPEIVPGGSSSGSAVVVSHGAVCFALGTDTAGSGRVPAALNNIVGLKPTLGSLSASGVVPACRTLDTVSVLALQVEDAYKVFEVLAEFDPDDAFSKRVPIEPLPSQIPKFKIGVPHMHQRDFLGDTHQENSYRNTIEMLKAQGHHIEEIDFSHFFEVAPMLYGGPWLAERYTLIKDLLENQPDAIFPITAQSISAAANMSAADVFEGMYRLKELSRKIEPIMERVDLLCVPSIPTFLKVEDVQADPVHLAAKLGIYAIFVNMLDMCGIALPVAQRDDGKPGGITLLASAGKDAMLSGLARTIEQEMTYNLGATNWPNTSCNKRAGDIYG